jgi:hypothetical protein
MPGGDSVQTLADDLLQLSADVDGLVREIEQELDRSEAPWAVVRAKLGERVLPLSLKDGSASIDERRQAGLERQRVRLLREGAVLREAHQAIARRLVEIQERWDAVTHHSARLREWSLLASQQHRIAAAWSAEVREYYHRWHALREGR